MKIKIIAHRDRGQTKGGYVYLSEFILSDGRIISHVWKGINNKSKKSAQHQRFISDKKALIKSGVMGEEIERFITATIEAGYKVWKKQKGNELW